MTILAQQAQCADRNPLQSSKTCKCAQRFLPQDLACAAEHSKLYSGVTVSACVAREFCVLHHRNPLRLRSIYYTYLVLVRRTWYTPVDYDCCCTWFEYYS